MRLLQAHHQSISSAHCQAIIRLSVTYDLRYECQMMHTERTRQGRAGSPGLFKVVDQMRDADTAASGHGQLRRGYIRCEAAVAWSSAARAGLSGAPPTAAAGGALNLRQPLTLRTLCG